MTAMEHDIPDAGRHRRKSKWAPGGTQVKIGSTVFSVAVIVLLLNLQFGVFGLWRIYEQPPATVDLALDQAKYMLVDQFVVLLVAVTVLSIWAARSFFNVFGPIHCFKRYLLSLVDGRWDGTCRNRDGDRLQEMKDAINSAVGLLTGRVKSQHELLQEIRGFLETDRDASSGDRRAAELMARIDAESLEHARRFPETSPEDSHAALTAVE